MKPRVYIVILFFLVPLQATLFNPFSFGGTKPDIALAFLYIIGLYTGPTEGALAGIGIGLLQDIGSAGLLGMSGFTRGLFGLSVGLLGKNVLDIANPLNFFFLTVFSLAEGLLIALFMQIFYGSIPFFSIFFTRVKKVGQG